MLRPEKAQWPWEVRHGRHVACYLRAYVPGDFVRPDARPMLPNYVVYPDGSTADPQDPAVQCHECRQPLTSENISIIGRDYDEHDWLAESRALARRTGRWPRATRAVPASTCYWCGHIIGPDNGRGDHRFRLATPGGVVLERAGLRICDGCALYASPVPMRHPISEQER